MAMAGKIEDLLATARDEKLKKALHYLKSLPPGYMENRKPGYVGRVQIEGDEIFAIHQVYETAPESSARFEGHKKYTDLQYIISGNERIFLAPDGDLAPVVPYDEDKDIAFYKPERHRELLLKPGMVAIFQPKDLHAPGISPSSGVSVVRKTVVKVRV